MKIFAFGHQHSNYTFRVFNEREVRAAAGTLFAGASLAFYHALLLGEYTFLKIFITFFLVDFAIRLFINTDYSPSLILGRLMVKNQKPEYTGAPQKRFAWALGLGIAITMFILVVILNIFGTINLIFCLACLTFLFFESAFGICLGCLMYKTLTKKKPGLCPGDVCEITITEPIQKVSRIQFVTLILAMTALVLAYLYLTRSVF